MSTESWVHIAFYAEDGACIDQGLAEIPEDWVTDFSYRGDKESHVAEDDSAEEHAQGWVNLEFVVHTAWILTSVDSDVNQNLLISHGHFITSIIPRLEKCLLISGVLLTSVDSDVNQNMLISQVHFLTSIILTLEKRLLKLVQSESGCDGWQDGNHYSDDFTY